MPTDPKDISIDAMNFLKEQRLTPIPQNYVLAYFLKQGDDTALTRAVDEITDGGVRMSQAQADNIFSKYIGALGKHGSEEVGDRAHDLTRHHAIRLAEIANHAAGSTGTFNRELAAGYEKLDNVADTPFGLIISQMIERSLRAEQELASAARQVESLRQELETARHDANIDALTGLANRRAIEAYLATLTQKAGSFLIAICDIDRFKSINDRYGHAVGDRVLKTVATSLSESCAPHKVGRWGGKEFVVLLEGLALEQGVDLLDEARRRLGQRHFKLRETDEPMGSITFSAGVALVTRDDRDHGAAQIRADEALYRAKNDGRDQVRSERD